MTEQSYPGAGYPAMPGEPAQLPAMQGPPPPSVANAVKLMMVRAALSLLGLLVLFGTKSSLKEQILKADPTLSATKLDTALTVAITVGIVVAVIFTALYVLLALQVRKGKSWARIVTLVLAALSVLSGLSVLTQPATGLTRLLGVVDLALDVAIIVLLLLRPSAEYFRRRT
jgi:hypothetical protein